MQYAIKITNQNGNWEACSKDYAEHLLYFDKESFLRIHTISDPPYFFYLGCIPKFDSYQEENFLCRKLREKMGNSLSFRPISQTKCLYLDRRGYGRANLSNVRIRNLRKRKKNKDPVKETPFETLRRKHREKEIS